MPFDLRQSGGLQEERLPSRRAISKVEVKFSKGKQQVITIYEGDTAAGLALIYAKIYNLNHEKKQLLKEMLTNYLANLESSSQAADEEQEH